MPSPDYAYAYETTCDVDGIVEWVSFSVKDSSEEIEFTNLSSGRRANGKPSYEGGTGVVTTDFNGEVVVDKDAIHTVQTGNKVEGVSATFPDGRSISGDLNIANQEFKGAVKGGYQYTMSGKFTGLVTGL